MRMHFEPHCRTLAFSLCARVAGMVLLAAAPGCVRHSLTGVGALLPVDDALRGGVHAFHEFRIPIGEDVFMPTRFSLSGHPVGPAEENAITVTIGILLPAYDEYHEAEPTWWKRVDMLVGGGIVFVDDGCDALGDLGIRLLLTHRSRCAFEIGYVWRPTSIETGWGRISDFGGAYASFARQW